MSIRGSPAPRRCATFMRRCARDRISPFSAASSITSSSTICGSSNTRSPFPICRPLSTSGSKTPANSTGSSPVGMKRAGPINTTAGNTKASTCRRHWPNTTSIPRKALPRRPSGWKRGRRPAIRHCSIRIASTRSCAATTPRTRLIWSNAQPGARATSLSKSPTRWRAIRAVNAPARSATPSAGPTIRPVCR